MANCISNKYDNQLTSMEEVKQYLQERINHLRSIRGQLTNEERELQDILDMLN